MPSPVGHSLAGCCLLAAARGGALDAGARFAVAVLVAANLPDVDFALGPLLRPLGVSLPHQGPTHSLAFVALAALALAPAARAGNRPWTALGWLLGAGSLHLALDFVSHDDFAPIGLPLLWPLSGAYLHAPVELFPGTDRDNVLGGRNALQLLAELAWTLPPLALLLRRRPRPALPGRP